MSLEYIRQTYGVPAYRGAKVKYTDCDGAAFFCTIKAAKSARLSVLVDDRVPGYRGRLILHPTWNVGYLTSATTERRPSLGRRTQSDPAPSEAADHEPAGR